MDLLGDSSPFPFLRQLLRQEKAPAVCRENILQENSSAHPAFTQICCCSHKVQPSFDPAVTVILFPLCYLQQCHSWALTMIKAFSKLRGEGYTHCLCLWKQSPASGSLLPSNHANQTQQAHNRHMGYTFLKDPCANWLPWLYYTPFILEKVCSKRRVWVWWVCQWRLYFPVYIYTTIRLGEWVCCQTREAQTWQFGLKFPSPHLGRTRTLNRCICYRLQRCWQ